MEKATTDKGKPSLIDYGASTASAYGIQREREGSSYLQVGYRGVRRGYGAPRRSCSAWGGWEQAGAGLSKLGVRGEEARVGSLDAIRRASSCAGVGDEVDWSGVGACAYTVVRGFLTVYRFTQDGLRVQLSDGKYRNAGEQRRFKEKGRDAYRISAMRSSTSYQATELYATPRHQPIRSAGSA